MAEDDDVDLAVHDTPDGYIEQLGNNLQRTIFLNVEPNSALTISKQIVTARKGSLINKLYIKSKCIQVYEGFHTSV